MGLRRDFPGTELDPIEILLGCLTAAVTHFFMSFCQTLFHLFLGHHRIGGQLFRNHIYFHHVYYSKDHLVSERYLADEGNNTPFFLIPVFAAVVVSYILIPFHLFIVQLVTMAGSFCAHVYLDKQYHVAGSWLGHFSWFRRKQRLHFVHHRHANANFAVIDYFWDRLLGTFRSAEADDDGQGWAESRVAAVRSKISWGLGAYRAAGGSMDDLARFFRDVAARHREMRARVSDLNLAHDLRDLTDDCDTKAKVAGQRALHAKVRSSRDSPCC